jgi:hypothetical protein
MIVLNAHEGKGRSRYAEKVFGFRLILQIKIQRMICHEGVIFSMIRVSLAAHNFTDAQ